MIHYRHKIALGILASILIVASGLWGLLTYRLVGFRFALPGEGPDGVGAWGVLLILAIGLGIGWMAMRCVTCSREPPGGIWTMLIAGVFGAWLGGVLVGKWGWGWRGVNLIGSPIVAFGLAWGVGQISTCLGGRRRGSR